MSTLMKSENRQKSGLFRLSVLAFLLLFVPFGYTQAASGIDVSKIPQLKPPSPDVEKEFVKSAKKIAVDKPYGDDLLSYEISMPAGWGESKGAINSQVDGKLSNEVLSIVARYNGPAKNFARSHIVIEAQILKYEMSAQNWFINFVLKNGLTLNAIDVRSSKELEALYVQVDKDNTYVVRTRLIINGSRLVMTRYYLPQENHEEEKIEQALVTRSLKMTKPSAENIEEQRVYGFLDQSYFNYPSSWTLQAKDIFSIERMSVLLYHAYKEEKVSVLEGHIRINVISKLLGTTMDQEVQTFRNSIKIEGYTLGAVIESLRYEYNSEMRNGKAQTYQLVAADPVNRKSYEFLASVMESNDYYYITSMITPSRDEDFPTWAQNIEAFRIINESMRRFDAPKIDPNDPYYNYLKE